MALIVGLGERIRQVRGTRTQREFALLHGTSQGYISDLERDRAQPSFNFLFSLMDRDNISLDWLLTGNGSQHRTLAGLGRSGGPGSDSVLAPGDLSSGIYRRVDELLGGRPDLSVSLLDFLDSLLGKK